MAHLQVGGFGFLMENWLNAKRHDADFLPWRESFYIAAHRFWRDDPAEYFREIEAIMRDLEGRPHWGKMNSRTAADLRPAYPRFDDFLAVRDRLDPDRVFQNDYLKRVLGD